MILLLLILEIFLFWQNYTPGTYFLGWDNLFPEMNFSENIRRSLFAVWQEDRGLGLLDGMSFAANLPHYLFLYLLSFFLPQNLLRYFFFFLMHFLGGAGMYLLISKLKTQNSKLNNSKITSFLGALFYQYNLATIQMFYAPYELFAVHFAFLPWLVLFVLRFLGSGRRGDLLKFALLSFFAIPQAHVPTIFLVYLFAIFVFAGFFLLGENVLVLREKIKRIFLLFLLVFSLNVFWGLPYIYSTLENAEIIANSKINQMSTEEIYLRNRAFGDLKSVWQMKGFFFETMERKTDGGREYLLKEWREQTQKPSFLFFSSFFFVLSILGIVKVLLKREKIFYPFVFLFFFAIFMLGSKVSYEHLPFVKQIFRFTFTKFAFLYAFSFTVLLVLGAILVEEKLGKVRQGVRKLFWGGIFLGLFLYSLPAFCGYFLSPFFRVRIPQEYFAVVEFFKEQSLKTRIATLPQPDFWGWTYTSWGYRGSGFLWYGIPQATLDGAFYPWSRENENYYWEISHALYSQDLPLLEKVLEKYRITWLLVDENVISPDSPKALYFEKLEEMLSESKKISLARDFGKIKIYETHEAYETHESHVIEAPLQVEPGYSWGNFDQAYFEGGDYYSTLTGSGSPARGFFGTGEGQDKDNNSKKKDKDTRQNISDNKRIHNFLLSERRVNFQLISQQASVPSIPNNTTGNLAMSSPATNGAKTITAKNTWPALSKILAKRNNSSEENTGSLGNGLSKLIQEDDNKNKEMVQWLDNPMVYYPFRSLFTRGRQEELGFEIEEREDKYIIKNTILRYYDITILKKSKLVIPEVGEELVEVDKEDLEKVRYLKPEIKWQEDGDNSWTAVGKVLAERSLGVRVPKMGGVYSYESEKDPDFSGKKIFQGDSFADIYLPNLPHRYSYLVAIEARNLAGRPLLFWVENLNSRRQDLQTYLEKGESWQKHYFILPPMEKDGLGYTLHFENTPIFGEKRENQLRQVTVNPFPYKFLTGLKVMQNPSGRLKIRSVLVLPQSFERGWKLYKYQKLNSKNQKYISKIKNFLAEKLPFVFGEEIKDHVLVNNWANGWLIEKSKVKSQKLKVIYLPQYLEYFGFLLLGGSLGIISLMSLIRPICTIPTIPSPTKS